MGEPVSREAHIVCASSVKAGLPGTILAVGGACAESFGWILEPSELRVCLKEAVSVSYHFKTGHSLSNQNQPPFWWFKRVWFADCKGGL